MVLFDRKLIRNSVDEARRIRAFADAAIEGLVVIDGERVVDANRSFLQLAGYDEFAAMPATLAELFSGFDPFAIPAGGESIASECRLLGANGTEHDVEVLLRRLDWRGAERQVLAVRDISERKEAAARIAHLAYHDALTGLPNRTVFAEHLSRGVDKAAELKAPIAVLCVDLDGFKAVNDMHGHPAGDELLIDAAHRLRSVVRGNELVARLGGDEFAIIQEGGSQPTHAGLLSERLSQLRLAMSERGYDVELDTREGLPILRENNCPYLELAANDRGICELEQEVFEQVLGTSVRLAHCCQDSQHCCEFEVTNTN